MEGAVQAVAIVAAIWILLIAVLIFAGRGQLAREIATLVPDIARLFAGLLRDPAVPRRAKIVLAVAAVWIASPIDLIPEFIPVAGPLDDAIVAALALRYVVRASGRAVVARHWPGSPEMLQRLLRLA